MKKQTTFCYCPQCNKDLVSSNSLVSDKEEVIFQCYYCRCISYWDFDIAPVPILKGTNSPS